jgi:hypothetical protein
VAACQRVRRWTRGGKSRGIARCARIALRSRTGNRCDDVVQARWGFSGTIPPRSHSRSDSDPLWPVRRSTSTGSPFSSPSVLEEAEEGLRSKGTNA